MFAVVYIGGKQYKVYEKDEVEVEKMDLEVGKNVKIKEVLLLADEDGKQVKLGMPYVSGAHVECQVLEQGKADKIRIFKFKAKKRYARTQGHRQSYTLLKVLKISAVEKKAGAVEEKEEGSVTEKLVSKPKTSPKIASKTVKKAVKVKK